MAFCTECGAKLPDGALFCPNCGMTLAAASEKGETASVAQEDIINTDNTDGSVENDKKDTETEDSGSASEGSERSAENSESLPDFSALPLRENHDESLGYPHPGEPLPKKSNGVPVAVIVIATVVVLLTIAAVVYFSAARGKGLEPAPEPTQTQLPDGSNVAGSGELADGAFHVAMVGATGFVDDEGTPVMRVYYEFTNNFSYPLSSWDALDFYAIQNGNELEARYTWSDIDVYYNYKTNIRPGVTIQCCYEFNYDPNGSNVDFSIFSWDEGIDAGAVTATYDPQDLPGEPAPYVIKPIPAPQWTVRLQSEGTLDDEFYVSVLDAELLDDADGEPALRVYYEFTNNSDENFSLYNALCLHTYQDGVALGESYVENPSETDANLDRDVAPGETIKASLIFRLRNESSAVEAEVEAGDSYDSVGQTYQINK